jgi:hypothetical protein
LMELRGRQCAGAIFRKNLKFGSGRNGDDAPTDTLER